MLNACLVYRRIITCIGILFLSLSANSQPLAWSESADETFVFKLSDQEALRLMKGDFKEKHWKEMIASPFTTFTDTWENQPEQGHFVLTSIHKNRVNYQYYPIIPFQVFLFKEYGALTLQVVDFEGKIRKDAKIRLGMKTVSFDKKSCTYSTRNVQRKGNHLLTIELDGFRAIFDLTKNPLPYWARNYRSYHDTKEFYSYMITDKNKYKPGETVRFKSYALSARKEPLAGELELWLQIDDSRRNYKKVKSVSPYYAGGFAGEFQLADSLKLQLDRWYNFQLRDMEGRVVAVSRFKYEDYQLNISKLEVRLISPIQYRPQKNQIEITATDANGLLLQGVEAEITVCRGYVTKSYTDLLTLPDTLMTRKVTLESSTPTLVEISSDLFGPADYAYIVNVLLLTADHQWMEEKCTGMFYHSCYKLLHQTHGDTIHFSFEDAGLKQEVEAELRYNNQKEIKKVKLPYEEKFNQFVQNYQWVVPGKDYKSTTTANEIESKLDVIGGIVSDSLNLYLKNPLKLQLSWYMYRKGQLIAKGSGTDMEYKAKSIDPQSVYSLEIFYFIGNNEYTFRRTFTTKSDLLSIESDLPVRVYPGQKVETTLIVKDTEGNPVPDVDLTAMSSNSQLDYVVPNIPSFGPMPEARRVRPDYTMGRGMFTDSCYLDYPYWNQLAHLDKLPFYQFSYPGKCLFTYTVDVPGNKTQFAPYVMKNGESVQIYVIELNNDPCYFSWSEQMRCYSFPIVSTGTQKLTLRLHDRAIVLDSIIFVPGKKTILSLDLDHLPAGVKEVRLNTKDKEGKFHFTPVERERYKKYICRFPVPASSDFACFENIAEMYPVYLSYKMRYQKELLAGPIKPGYGRYAGGVWYNHLGGFAYQFEDNIVYRQDDQHLFPDQLRFTTSTDFRCLNDFYLTSREFYQLLEDARKGNIWHPASISLILPELKLNLTLPVEKDSTGVANLLFKDRSSERMIIPDTVINKRRIFTQLKTGAYDIILLYNNGKYLRKDSVILRPYTYQEVNMQSLAIHETDSLSLKWLHLKHSPFVIGNYKVNYQTKMITYPRKSGNIVRGHIYDMAGEPLPGCSVVIRGTKQGTITNLDGFFELPVSMGNILRIAYVGYDIQEIAVTPNTELTVILQESNSLLDEVVVVGYGTAKKYTLTGSVAGRMAGTKETNGSVAPEKLDMENKQSQSEEAEDKLYQQLLQLNSIRKNFSDVGFWEPRLITDGQGKARFTVTFPDNITKWQTVVYGMNRHLKTGMLRQSIRSYKPLMAELRTPAFLTKGDQSDFVGMISNYTGDAEIKGKVEFSAGEDSLSSHEVTFATSFNETSKVKAVGDSVTARFKFTREDGYMDGEERKIPVVPQGTEIADGTLGILKDGETVNLQASDGEELTVTLSNKQLDTYLETALYLKNYKYLCNEQMASKLIGLLALKQYAHYKREPFEGDKLVHQLIRRLQDNQNDKSLWAWWGNSENSSYWMSVHILNALKMAKDAGYGGINISLDGLKKDYALNAPYQGMDLGDIGILNALYRWGEKNDYVSASRVLFAEVQKREQEEALQVKKNKEYKPLSFLREKLLLWEMQQQTGGKALLDSIRPYLVEDALGGVYCDDGKQASHWYIGRRENTLIAYRMIQDEPTFRSVKEAMRLYLLSTKQQFWNTYEASFAVGTVLMDVLKESDKPYVSEVILTGKENRTLSEFPFETKLSSGERLTLEKKSGIPLIYSTYKKKLVTKVNSGKAFDVSTALIGRNTLTQVEHLLAGTPVDLKVTLTVKQEAEYVMVEVPIPAGCSYESKPNYSFGSEVHREYFKEKTVIFCQQLPKGTYKFVIPLLPRYTGKYTLNPAKVELMYFPAVNANNDMREIEIRERNL